MSYPSCLLAFLLYRWNVQPVPCLQLGCFDASSAQSASVVTVPVLRRGSNHQLLARTLSGVVTERKGVGYTDAPPTGWAASSGYCHIRRTGKAMTTMLAPIRQLVCNLRNVAGPRAASGSGCCSTLTVDDLSMLYLELQERVRPIQSCCRHPRPRRRPLLPCVAGSFATQPCPAWMYVAGDCSLGCYRPVLRRREIGLGLTR